MELDADSRQRVIFAAQRNQLALERTLLSWVRTGLGGIGGGFAIIRFLNFNSELHQMAAFWIGELLMLWGVAIIIMALFSYRRECKRIEKITVIEIIRTHQEVAVWFLVIFSIGLMFLGNQTTF